VRANKKLKRKGEFWLIRSLIGLARLLPRRLGQRTFSVLAGLASGFFERDRRRAAENLAMAFPGAEGPVLDAWVRAMFKSLGCNIYEMLRLENITAERLDRRVERVEGIEHLEAAHARGRGLVVITGHIGCWELMPAYFTSRGYKVSVIARRMKVNRLNQQLVAMRRSFGVETLDRDSSPRAMLEPLHRGDAIGVLIDQHTSVAGVYVPFFGKPAHTPTAVAKIAMLTRAPILPMAVFVGRNGKHVIHVLPPIEAPEGVADRSRAIRELTEQCSLAVEKLIRIDPKQWVWFHHRWRQAEEHHVVAATA